MHHLHGGRPLNTMDNRSFMIPGIPGDQYVIPVSGGADSTALAAISIYMEQNT